MSEKVLYISYDGMTDPLGQSQVIPYLAGLSKQGYQFTILSFEKKERYQKNHLIIDKILQEAGIHWEPMFFTAKPPLLSKLYDIWQMRKAAEKLMRKHKFRFIHCRSYVAASAGVVLKKKWGLPFLFDMRGFWVDERVDSGQWKLNNPVYRLFYKRYKRKEKVYFKESAHIISLTEKGKQELKDVYGISSEKVTVIPCCADLDHFDYNKINEKQRKAVREELTLKDEQVLTYLGSLGGWYLTDEMLDFFLVLKKKIPVIKFLFITQDPPGKIYKKCGERGVSKDYILVKAAQRAEVPLYLSISDWSIFFIKDAYSKKASSPTKQGEIMAMGIPLICNDIGDTGLIISGTNAGTIVPDFSPGTYEQLVGDVAKLKEISPKKIRDAAIEFYDLQKGIDAYLKVYKFL